MAGILVAICRCALRMVFWFVGRSNNLIKSAGHLIGPYVIESALLKHSAVAEVGVIGVPDETAGELVKAYVALKPNLDHLHERALLKSMIRTRRFEDQCPRLCTQQKTCGSPRPYNGEQAIASGIIPLLEPQDWVVATFREQGHALVRGVPMGAVLTEMYGRPKAVPR